MQAKQVRRVALIMESQVAPRRRMLAGVAQYIREHDPWAIYLKPAFADRALEHWLHHWRGDGIIAVCNEGIESLQHLDIPVVDILGIYRSKGVPLVRTDDRGVGRLGAEHLRGRGFKQFGFVEYPDQFWSNHRREAFEAHLAEHCLSCHVYRIPFPNVHEGGPELYERQQQELCNWLRALPKPAGVMCSGDLLAQQLLEACLRLKIDVPEQIAVVGADNDEAICDLCYPPLSSVIINDKQRGYVAAAVLDKMMNGEPAPEEIVWVEPTGVFSRASTDILAVNDELVAKALRFVREFACDQISVDDVTRQVPVSRSVLERRFRKAIGKSINGEIVRIRLNTAIELLSETDLPIKMVALKAGFGSTSYMNSMFRQKMKRTPGSYRGDQERRGRPPTKTIAQASGIL